MDIRTVHTLKGRTQPYGFWRAGNPIVKSCILLIGVIGILINNPSLVLQGAALIFIMLKLPVNPKSPINNILWTLGVGSAITSFFSPSFIIPYEDISKVVTIPFLGNSTIALCIIIFTFALYKVGPAITTRDYDWMIGIIPITIRKNISNLIYSYGYGFFRLKNIVWEADDSIRNRGVYRPFNYRNLIKIRSFENSVSIWSLYLVRTIYDLENTIKFVVASRIINKNSTIAKYWSSTDMSLLGVILFSIIIPRIY